MSTSAKALLVGCNYPGTDAELMSPVYDCELVKSALETSMGIPTENIIVLVDDGETATEETLPTKENIEATLQQLVADSQPGDHLLFFFSGHGTQVPSDDMEEPDGVDEAICPHDLTNLITDDDLRAILADLPEGVNFTMISDSCHSGTLLDQLQVVIEGPKENDPEEPEGMKDAFTQKCAGHGAHGGPLTKSIDICDQLSKTLGCEVGPGNIRYALAVANGRNCSTKYKGIWDIIDDLGLGDLGPLDILNTLIDEGQAELLPRAGVKCSECPCPESAILITGCGSDQLSEDTGEGSALTLALVEVLQSFKETYPDQDISYRSLVYYIRDLLLSMDKEQDPSLECTQAAADLAFLGGSGADAASSKCGGGGGGGGASSQSSAGIDLNTLMGRINSYRAYHQADSASWDEGLASQAQEWVNYLASTGRLEHGGHDGAGQNLYMTSDTSADHSGVCVAATDGWYSEVDKYDWNNPAFSMETGHFTQVVWRGSSRVGYAVASGQFGTFVAAHYAAAGNMQGDFQNNVLPPAA